MSTATAIIGARSLVIAGYVAPGGMQGVSNAAAVILDSRYGGTNRVTGTTKNTGTPDTPVRRRLRLHDQPTGRAVREVWSDATTGAYSFDNIRAGTFYVTAFDHTGQFSGVIETDVQSEPMP